MTKKVGMKFHLKLTILIFWNKFTQNGYLWAKMEKVNSIIEFYIFELCSLPKFNLK